MCVLLQGLVLGYVMRCPVGVLREVHGVGCECGCRRAGLQASCLLASSGHPIHPSGAGRGLRFHNIR